MRGIAYNIFAVACALNCVGITLCPWNGKNWQGELLRIYNE